MAVGRRGALAYDAGTLEQLSGLDASFLYLETPRMHLHVAMCAVLDPETVGGPLSFEAIVEYIRERVHLVPPFRRRLREDPLGLNHPFWVEDPDLDLIHHVRRVTLPAPGGERELGELVGRINSAPLPRSRPLWEIWVIEGLEGGRVAMVAKVHHAAVDGTTGAGLLVNLFSLKPQAPPVAPPKTPPPMTIPSDIDMLREAARARLAQPRKLVELAQKTARAVRAVADRRKGSDVAIGGTPLRAPRVSFNGALEARRDTAFARLPLAGLKAVKDAAPDTKLNDVILAVCTGVLRRYLEGRDGGLPGEALIATCPVSVGGRRGTNHVSAMFVPLPVQLPDPAARLAAIRRATRGAKEEHNALGAEMLQDWAELAAPTTFELASRFYTRLKLADRHRPVHNVIVSNVPGPPFPIYFAGAKLHAVYPMGPVLEGSGLNVTVMSYCGHVDFGFMVAKNLVPDVWTVADAVHSAYAELRAAHGLAADE